jgi:protein phosphatase
MGTLRIIEEASLTDVGRQRHGNEDNFLHAPPFFAVADGMGGAQAGEVASQLAVDTFSEQQDESASPEEQLTAIAKAANRKIYEMAQQDSSRAGMGTTLIAVKVGNGEVHVGHVGDSRLYRFRDDALERLTNDHSLVEELVRQGKLTPEEAETHPQRSVITRALGPEPDVEVETMTFAGKDGDVYLLCSDGLSGMVPDELLEQILRRRSSLEGAAQQLIDAANENGGRDNITAVMFRLGEEGAADDEDGQTVVGLDAGATKAHTVQQDTTAATDVVDDPDATVAPPPKAEAAPPPAPPPPRQADKRTSEQAKGPRKWPKLLLALVVLAALVVGAYFGIRSFFFIGVDNSGLLSLYRGVPYELPAGLDLYEKEYSSTVPARSIKKLERDRILDHQLRSRDDATDLINQRERIYAR